MQAQASTLDPARRKAHFDRVQEIVWEEAPIVYLVHRHALLALSPRLQNAAPSPFRPQAYWNIEFLYLDRP
jgi:ABC-type transport system substrate-binding protein